MIKLTFQFGREVMNFVVEGKIIRYTDRIFNSPLQCIPKDPEFINKIRISRNRYSPKLIDMFSLSKKQQDEYDKAVSEEELADIIIKDCKAKGIVLIKKEVENVKEK